MNRINFQAIFHKQHWKLFSDWFRISHWQVDSFGIAPEYFELVRNEFLSETFASVPKNPNWGSGSNNRLFDPDPQLWHRLFYYEIELERSCSQVSKYGNHIWASESKNGRKIFSLISPISVRIKMDGKALDWWLLVPFLLERFGCSDFTFSRSFINRSMTISKKTICYKSLTERVEMYKLIWRVRCLGGGKHGSCPLGY